MQTCSCKDSSSISSQTVHPSHHAPAPLQEAPAGEVAVVDGDVQQLVHDMLYSKETPLLTSMFLSGSIKQAARKSFKQLDKCA